MKIKTAVPKHIYVIIGFTFILSIVAILIALFRSEPLELDWAGFLVGGLAALSTVLVGWQIVNLLNLNSLQKGIDSQLHKLTIKLTQTYTEQIDKAKADLKTYTEITAMLSLVHTKYAIEKYENALSLAFTALQDSFSNESYAEMQSVAVSLIRDITNIIQRDINKYALNKTEKDNYIRLLLKLNDLEVLTIIDIIKLIKTKEEQA